MGGGTDRMLHVSGSVKTALVVFAMTAAVLLEGGRRDFPQLHTVLDTGAFILSGVLAALLWDMGLRLNLSLMKWIAVSFAVTLLLELTHAIVTVEWTGALAPIVAAAGVLRPATWPPAAHILPLGICCAVLFARRATALRFLLFTIALIVL